MRGPLPPLTEHQKAWLLALARAAVAAEASGRPLPGVGDADARLRLAQGAFVTLQMEGRLRGCIGTLSADRPLCEVVRDCASAAATEDPRFDPVVPEEITALRIEISALSEACAIAPAAVVIGRHGLVVTSGSRRGVLLPQVAVEHGWDAGTFVRETCIKAGLPEDACARGAALQAFDAEVFGEDDASRG